MHPILPHPCPTLDQHLASVPTDSLARDQGWLQRSPRKISPHHWVVGACYLAIGSVGSLSHFAWILSLLGGCVLSKQAVSKRLLRQGSRLLEHALLLLLSRQFQPPWIASATLKGFQRVLLQDSTLVRLPAQLAKLFPGPQNQHSGPTAQLRIQAVFDLLSGRYLHFGCSGFIRNDQRAAVDVLALLQPGDLVIRDLGYFVLQVFEQIRSQGASFLSRLRLDTAVLDPHTRKPIDLLRELRSYGRLDRPVLLGAQAQVACRLVALPVPPEVAAQRRRLARANRDRRLNPSSKRLALLGWQIFVTNASAQQLNPKQIAQVYRLRWHIETLFKAWKSHFHLCVIPQNASAAQVQVLVYARLIYILLFQTVFFPALQWGAWQDSHKLLSFLKTAKLFAHHQAILWAELFRRIDQNLLQAAFWKHGAYEQRRRLNLIQRLRTLS